MPAAKVAKDPAGTGVLGVPEPAVRGGSPEQPAAPGDGLVSMAWLAVAAVGYVLSFVLLAVSGSFRLAGFVVIVGAVCLLTTSIALGVLLRRLGPGRLAITVRIVIPVVMLIGGMAMLWLWFGSVRTARLLPNAHTEGWGFFGACLAIMGAGHLLTVARQSRFLNITRGIVLTAGCAAACWFGLHTLSASGPGWAVGLIAAGVLLSPVSMGLLTEDVVDRLVERRTLPWRGWGPALLGSALAAAGFGVWLLVASAGIELLVVVFIAAVLAILIGAVASNTPSDVVLTAGILTLIWANIPGGVDPQPVVQPAAGEDVIVALGDSFMSGEGAKRFYQGTNDKNHNECRRAPTAYAPVTVSRGGAQVPHHVAFVACSGARALDIYQRAQQPGDPIDRPEGGLPQLAHVDWLQANVKLDVRLVIVSIGGNDALFGDVAQACVAPGDCTEIGARWLARLAVVAPRLHQTYQRIRNYFGPDVPVLVVPYPVPLSPQKCSSSLLTEQEHRFLHGFAIELNKVLERAAADAGLYYLHEMADAFAARKLRICDDAAGRVGVNFLAMHAVSGLVEQSFNPQNWMHNSLHPNERGHQAMADVLQAWLTSRPYPTVPADPPPNAEQHSEPIESIESLMHDPEFRHCGTDPSIPHCDLETLKWAQAQVIMLARRGIGALLLTIGGLWAIWIWLIWCWRNRRTER
jgi:lysophospholipase L1-like esterase